MKNNKLLQSISLLLSIFPVLVYGFFYNALPEEIPSHWDFSGTIDGYSTKNEFFLLAILPLILWIFFLFLPKIDPKKENYQKFSGFYHVFSMIMVLFMDFVFLLCLYASFQEDSPFVSEIIPMAVGLLFVFIGNYLPKVKPNFFMGIKTPWTLSCETVWIKTHRKGGMAFVLLGIFMMVVPFFPQINEYVFATVVLLAILYPVILSYLYFQQERNEKK